MTTLKTAAKPVYTTCPYCRHTVQCYGTPGKYKMSPHYGKSKGKCSGGDMDVAGARVRDNR